MPNTELVPFEIGEDHYMVPVWMTGLPYVTDEKLEDLTLAAIAAAPSLEEAALEPEGAEKLKGHGGEVIKVLTAGWRPSTMPKSRWKVYALFDAELSDGTTELFSCGASRVVAVLDRAVREKRLPMRFRIFVGGTGDDGKEPMLALVAVRDAHEPFPDEPAK